MITNKNKDKLTCDNPRVVNGFTHAQTMKEVIGGCTVECTFYAEAQEYILKSWLRSIGLKTIYSRSDNKLKEI